MLPHERRSQVTEDAGITGVIRFRRQKLTGLQILQVEVLHTTKTFRAARLEFLRYGVHWRDATDMEAAQVVLKTGFVQAGMNFKVDGEKQCWDDKGNLIGNLVGGQLVRNDVEPVPYRSGWETSTDEQLEHARQFSLAEKQKTCCHDWKFIVSGGPGIPETFHCFMCGKDVEAGAPPRAPRNNHSWLSWKDDNSIPCGYHKCIKCKKVADMNAVSAPSKNR